MQTTRKSPVEKFARPLRTLVAGTALMISSPLLTACSDEIVSCTPDPPRKKRVQNKEGEGATLGLIILVAIMYAFKRATEDTTPISRREVDELRRETDKVIRGCQCSKCTASYPRAVTKTEPYSPKPDLVDWKAILHKFEEDSDKNLRAMSKGTLVRPQPPPEILEITDGDRIIFRIEIDKSGERKQME